MIQKDFINLIRENALSEMTLIFKCSDRTISGDIHYAKFKCNGEYYYFKGYSFTDNIYLCDDNFNHILLIHNYRGQ